MPQLAIFNMLFGFLMLFFAATIGAFLATNIDKSYLNDPAYLNSYLYLVQKSAHGHSNLFGMIQILFGLTLVYSKLPRSIKILQTAGFMFGSLAVSILLFVKSFATPAANLTFLQIFIGFCLSCFLLSLLTHAAGLWFKLRE